MPYFILATDSHRHTQTFFSTELAEKKRVSSLRDKKYEISISHSDQDNNLMFLIGTDNFI